MAAPEHSPLRNGIYQHFTPCEYFTPSEPLVVGLWSNTPCELIGQQTSPSHHTSPAGQPITSYLVATFQILHRYWDTLVKLQDILNPVKETIQLSELNIQGHARVWKYSCPPGPAIDLQAVPLEILLFCVKQGRISLHVSFIPHPIEMGSSEAIFLAFPRDDWQIKVLGQVETDFYVMSIDVSVFHKMINPAFDDHQLETSHRINMRDLMRLIPVNPSMMICFDQLMHHKLNHPFNQIFERAKFLEIFSLVMESAFTQPLDACPVTMSTVIESKLQKVRRHIIEHLDEAPDPDTLAVMYELPRNTLKEGYRYVYGKTIHQYHTDHKLESAMQMLNEGELLVKEVAFKIGYQNPSHFIAAFKKKFGHTPKQYLKRDSAGVTV